MPPPLRVVQLITELGPAGAERIVYELATRLDPGEFAVQVFSLRSPGPAGGSAGDDGAVADELRQAGIPVTPIRLRGKFDLVGALRLRRRLREAAPDLLHGHLFHGNLAARLLGRGCRARVISTIHVVERRPLRLRRFLERRTARADDVTVCVSPAVAAHARRDLGVASPRVIANGVDLAPFLACRQDPAAGRAGRDALGLPAGPVVGCLARLDPQKGLDVLLRAAALLPGVVVALAGAGTQREALSELARELGVADRVRFVGHQPAPRFLASIDVFCMPSRWEGFGLAAVEALASGIPVVATRVDSLPEVLGPVGVLVPAEDPVALAAALRRVVEDPEHARRIAAGGADQAGRFAVDAMVAEYAALYRACAGQDRSGLSVGSRGN